MIFNSYNFLIFIIILFVFYYFFSKENTRPQNLLLLSASYVFYGMADWKMIPLLLVATSIFFVLGILIKGSAKKKASVLVTFGVLLGIGILLYFKYFNFFIQSFSELFRSIGFKVNFGTFDILLPVGISFFTFKLLSYIIEINRGNIEPTRDFTIFANYIAFFPTILSGPIDRPYNLIPQFQKNHIFSYNLALDGCRQILWGMFKKMVIADNLAVLVNSVWSNIPNHSGTTLFITAIFYSIQIYCDFSGYSDMAIGVGKIFGFRITKNFNYPFFSRNISEFWRNWHMSLTSWLTDYVFMPLNVKFRNFKKIGLIISILLNFVLVGLWHGANWTFVVFGIYNGLLFIPLIISGSFFKKNKLKINKFGLPTSKDFIKILGTFLLVSFGLIVFRADNISEFLLYTEGFKNMQGFFKNTAGIGLLSSPIAYIVIMFVMEWVERDKEYALQITDNVNSKLLRNVIYWAFVIVIILNSGEEQKFIYFQF